MPDTTMPRHRPALLDADGMKALVEQYPKPLPRAVAKDIGRIDAHLRRFIERAPFCCLASCDSEGRVDVGPRGDPPGSFKVIDEGMIAIPDRPGNNRLDALRNFLGHARAGAIFMIPGIDETVRVNGRVALSTDPDLLASMAVDGKLPRCAIVIVVEEAYLHCAKAFRRSKLWSDDYRLPQDAVPSISRVIGEQLGESSEQIAAAEQRTERAYRDGLWAPV